jgi:hypothetical protein
LCKGYLFPKHSYLLKVGSWKDFSSLLIQVFISKLTRKFYVGASMPLWSYPTNWWHEGPALWARFLRTQDECLHFVLLIRFVLGFPDRSLPFVSMLSFNLIVFLFLFLISYSSSYRQYRYTPWSFFFVSSM